MGGREEGRGRNGERERGREEGKEVGREREEEKKRVREKGRLIIIVILIRTILPTIRT